MVAGFNLVKSSFVCVWDEMLSLMGANLIWFAATLLISGLLWLVLPQSWVVTVAFLSIVLPTPLSAGLHMFVNQTVRGETAELSLVWQGFTRNLRRVLIVLGIDCVILAIIVVNLRFYLDGSGPLRIVSLLWLAILTLWLGMHMYLNPLLHGRSEKGIAPLFRDSLFLVVANPIFTMTVLAIVLLTILLSTMLGLAVPLLMMAFIALLENKAVAVLTEKYSGRKVGQNGSTIR